MNHQPDHTQPTDAVQEATPDPEATDILAATRPNPVRNLRLATDAQKRRMRSSKNPGMKRPEPTAEDEHRLDLAAARAKQISEDMLNDSRAARRPGTNVVGVANTIPAGYPATPVVPLIKEKPTKAAIHNGVAVRPAPADLPHAPEVLRTHYKIESERVQQIKALALTKIDCGRIGQAEMKHAAERLGVSVGHCRRMVREFINDAHIRDRTHYRPKITVPDMTRLQQAYFLTNGDAAKAYSDYLDVETDLDGASLRTFQRIVNEWATPLKAAARHGIKGMITHQVFNHGVIPYRGYAYGMDHTKLSIRVLPERGTSPDFPWLTTCTDLHSDVTMAYRLTFGDPNHQTILDVLAEAVRGIHTLDGMFVGGKPEYLRTDRGADFISKAVNSHLLNLDILRQLSKPYQSWQNGKTERRHREIDTKFAPDMPGYFAGGADAYSRRTGALHLPDESLVRIDVLDRRLGEWFGKQNNTPRKSRDNKTPYDLWRESDAEQGIGMPEASHDEIVYAMSPRGSAKVQHYGLDARTRRYQGAVVKRLRDAGVTHVDLRYHEHDLDSVEVFVGDEWQGTAQRVEKRSQAQKAALVAAREAQTEAIRDLQRAADNARVLRERARQAAEGVPEHELPQVPFPDTDEEAESPGSDEDQDPFSLEGRDYSDDFADDAPIDPATGYPFDPATGEITD